MHVCTHELQVFVMNQHWGDAYFHFVVENLARITFTLDILRENLDIKVPAVSVAYTFRFSRFMMAWICLRYTCFPNLFAVLSGFA